MDQRHLWMRSSQQHAVLRVRSEIEQAIADFFYEREFVLIDSPILTGSSVEGTSTLFETDYFGDKAYLSQSGQLYLEPAAAAFGKVYCFGPTFRAEKSKTRRHLTEFWMVEPEVAFLEFEGLVRARRGLHRRRSSAARSTAAGRTSSASSATSRSSRRSRSPFRGSPTARAIAQLQKKGFPVKFGDDLGADEETALCAGPRPAADRLALPGRDQVVLHAAGPAGPGGRPRPRHARAGGLRRDHRRLAAHPRPRAPRAAARGAQAAARGLRVVPRRAPLRDVPALRASAWASSAS